MTDWEGRALRPGTRRARAGGRRPGAARPRDRGCSRDDLTRPSRRPILGRLERRERNVRRRELLLAGLAGLAGHAEAAEETPKPAAGAPLRTHGLALVGMPRLPPGFPHFPYVNPDAPKGGDVALAEIGSFDSFNPFIVRGTAPARVGVVWDTLMRETADELDTGYAHLADGDRDRRRSQLRRLRAAPGGAFSRRRAGDGLRRRLDVRYPAREGPAVLSPVLCRRGARRGGRRPARGVPLQDPDQPRTADDPRRTRRAAQAFLGGPRLLRAVDRSAARFGPLSGRAFRVRPHAVAGARRGILGEGAADRDRARQFRHHAQRIFPRRDGGAAGLQGRPDRLAAREHLQGLVDGI